MENLRRGILLLVIGLIFLLIGGVCLLIPIRIVIADEEHQLTVGPRIHDSADLPLGLAQGQSARVTVTFEEEAKTGQREVCPLIFYMYPNKGLIETVARFVNQSEVSFVIGWENASYLTVFITGFVIRVFYEGSSAVVVDCTVIKLGNPASVAGVVLLIASAIPLWAFVLGSRRNQPTTLFSNKT